MKRDGKKSGKSENGLSKVGLFLAAAFVSGASWNVSAEQVNVVFVGDSITFGQTLGDRDREAPPVRAAEWLESNYALEIGERAVVRFRNTGVGGLRADELLPDAVANGDAKWSRWGDVEKAGRELENEPGPLVFSMMIGANDSGGYRDPEGPHSPQRFHDDLTALCTAILTKFPTSLLVVNQPTGVPEQKTNDVWKAYFPVNENVVKELGGKFARRIFMGDTKAWDLLSSRGKAAYNDQVHPNACSAAELGKLWGEAIKSACGQTNEQYLYRVPAICAKLNDGVRESEIMETNYVCHSGFYPESTRKLTIAVPAVYDGKTPAAVCVCLDGILFNLTTLVPNLMAEKSMPTTIVVGVSSSLFQPGRNNADNMDIRSYEYEMPSPRLGAFLLSELLPYVEKLQTQDGRPIKLSRNGCDRMIAGMSSGGVAAFLVGWYFPSEISRVYCSNASFSGHRGGNILQTTVPKMEPKSFRVFLQSGTRDVRGEIGDLWAANRTMARALEFAGYDCRCVWGKGFHSTVHSTALMPDALRYLWKDWPKPVSTPIQTRNGTYNAVVDSKEPFTKRNNGFPRNGNLLAVAPDGAQLVIDSERPQLQPKKGNKVNFSMGERPMCGAALADGTFYVGGARQIYRLTPDGGVQEAAHGMQGVGALAVTGKGGWLCAFETNTRKGYRFRIEKDGTLTCKHDFYEIYLYEGEKNSAVTRDVLFDNQGHAFLATGAGVQVCDATGHSEAILPLPFNEGAVALCFGNGKEGNLLFVKSERGNVYQRKMKVQACPVDQLLGNGKNKEEKK